MLARGPGTDIWCLDLPDDRFARGKAREEGRKEGAASSRAQNFSQGLVRTPPSLDHAVRSHISYIYVYMYINI